MPTKDIKVPDIGDFTEVPVIEIHVKPGDAVSAEDPLITLESDKATMDVPAPEGGVVQELKVSVGDKIAEGSVILTLESAGASEAAPAAASNGSAAAGAHVPAESSTAGGSRAQGDLHAEVLVLGAGPGGYTAAFRAADLGAKVVLIERWPTLGGVCLNVGCIPSKALLHAAKVISEAEEMGPHGVKFSKPEVDIDALRGWKDGVVGKLTGGLTGLAKARKVTVVRGVGQFAGPNMVEVETVGEDGSPDGGRKTVSFDKCVIAAGSEAVHLPFMPWDDPRVVDSTGALELDGVPDRMLVVGGGIIGLEMATVYQALGSKITVVELTGGLMAGADPDMVKPWQKRMEPKFEKVLLNTKVTAAEATGAGIKVAFEDAKGEPTADTFDKVLVSVGRIPNGNKINAQAAGVAVDQRGFIAVDRQMRTNAPHIFAIGDIVGQPMLAHKAVHEGKVAAEVCCGHKSAFDAKVIPNVAYTDPEVAWVGLTELQAKEKGQKIGKGVFPWAASGRALSNERAEGVTKVIFDPETNRVLGAGIVGPNAGDLISEVALAIELGADAEDIGLTVHPHPTLSETVAMAAEMFEGTITDLMPPKR
ncbi:MAG: dihydrolipoyl dehydrogenase [Pseudomonadota bacterium]